ETSGSGTITSRRGRSMRKQTLVWWSLCIAAAALPSPAWSQTPEEVNRAIDRGVDYLKAKQRINGSWDEYGDYEGGVTSLAALALLSCDVRPDDEKIQKALSYLRGIDPDQ